MLTDPISIITALILSGLIVVVSSLPRLRIGLNLGDEGYLWYGTLQTLEGRIPIRDFRAYDPGRYYWFGGWMRLLGRGLIELRITFLITQVLTLTIGILILNYHLQNWWITVAAGIILAAVMKPIIKILEFFSSSAAVFVAVMLLDNPAPENFFLAGIIAGLSFFFGLNLGLYNLTALSFIVSYLLVTSGSVPVVLTVLLYAAGIATGWVPMLAMLLWVPGFLQAYWEKKILAVFRRGTTNLKIPYPWLWRPTPNQLRHYSKFYRWCFKACFTLLPFTYAVLLGSMLLFDRGSVPANHVLIASLYVGIPYAHYIFARADISHLLVGGYPLLFGLSVDMLRWQSVWTAILAVLVAGFFWIASLALTLKYTKRWTSDSLVATRFDNRKLRLPEHQANYLQTIGKAVDTYSEPGDPVLFLPTLAALYPLLNRRAPVYDIYCIYAATTAAQKEMIRSLSEQEVKLAVIDNSPVDGMADRAWERTHPLVFDYLQKEYMRIDTNSKFRNLLMYLKKVNS